MIINIEEIGDSGLHVRTSRKPEWVTNIPEIVNESSILSMKGNVEFEFTVTKILSEISVKGSLHFIITSLCSRCLEPVTINLNPEINLLLSPGNFDKDHESNIDIENYDYGDEEIDLSDYLKEKIAVSIPVKVVCHQECSGLCSNCGTNLNHDSCSCESDWIDPRLEKLKNLKV